MASCCQDRKRSPTAPHAAKLQIKEPRGRFFMSDAPRDTSCADQPARADRSIPKASREAPITTSETEEQANRKRGRGASESADRGP